MATPPPVEQVTYNQRKRGYCGQLGTGAHAEIRFLQTGLHHEELDNITLIENIPGSEMWEVRDLFQRDVDKERVTRDILPYLKNDEQVKFFNPLTLMLLPLASDSSSISQELPQIPAVREEDDGHGYQVFENPRVFKFKVHEDTPAYSSLEWNDQATRVVAVDGQHRLSALKRWKNEPPESAQTLATWTIPVVILGVFRSGDGGDAPSLLEVVRKTFVYINSKAQSIHSAREILLDDERVNALCTQELIQDAHSNDCRALSEREAKKPPLILFDWRGEVRNGERVPAPAALKTVEELRDWFDWYILGEDGSEEQGAALGLQDLVPPLATFGPERALSHDDSRRVRERFRATLLPALQHLLQEFQPYKQYIAMCRAIEKSTLEESDLAHHAFSRLRFGTSRASDDIRQDVHTQYEELVHQFGEAKHSSFDELLVLDIGMRGIMSAYGYGKEVFDDDHARTTDWLEYTTWFTEQLNGVYTQGWFRSYNNLDRTRKKILTHVTFDPSGAITNYKLDAQDRGFGALLAILVFHEGREALEGTETLDTVWDDCTEALKTPLRSGHRKQQRAALEAEFQGTPAEFRAEVNKKANIEVGKQIKVLARHLERQ